MDDHAIPSLPSLEFSRAKSELSDVMTRVVHEHRPSIVSRHRGKERMLLVRTDDLLTELRVYTADYFERHSFYAATDRSEHAPWLLRFALTSAAEQRALLADE